MTASIYDSDFGPVDRTTRIIYTGGSFDILHVGHINLLSHCRKIVGHDGLVIVGLNTDEYIREEKGDHPVNNYAAREKMLLSISGVNAVLKNEGGSNSVPVINQAFMQENPNHPRLEHWFTKFILVGSDWAKRNYYRQMGFTQEWLDEKRITLCYIPYTEGVSSSRLRRHIID